MTIVTFVPCHPTPSGWLVDSLHVYALRSTTSRFKTNASWTRPSIVLENPNLLYNQTQVFFFLMNSSDDAKQREDLIEAFGVELISDDALLAECVSSTFAVRSPLMLFCPASGINLCQMFNITPADLHYKWEALNFNSKAAFDMNAVRELKAQMLRQNERKAEIARLNQRVALSNPTRGGLRMSGAGILNIGRFSNGLAGTPVKTEPGRTTAFQVKEDHKRPVVAGPSKVKFEGPPMSDEAKKGRACAYPPCH